MSEDFRNKISALGRETYVREYGAQKVKKDVKETSMILDD